MAKTWLASLIAVSPANFASALNAGGKDSYVHVMNDGIVMFHMNQFTPRFGLPPRAVGSPACDAFNSTAPVGQAKLSLLLTAYASGKDVAVYGLN